MIKKNIIPFSYCESCIEQKSMFFIQYGAIVEQKVVSLHQQIVWIMLRDVIIGQRKERDKLLSRQYLRRNTKYDLDAYLQSKQIKLITGPRRAGKSTEALLMLHDKNFAYLNFDNDKLLGQWEEESIMGILDSVYPNYDFLLLDEVQNLPNWYMWVSRLYRLGVNMIITGSNARMLSSEMSTVLTGRYLPIELLPFSLREVFEWQSELSYLKDYSYQEVVNDYLHNGGFPETLESRPLTGNYLSTLFDAIIWKDIVRRHKVRNTTDLNNLAMYLVSNVCNLCSANQLADDLGLSSVATTKKFMNYLHEPYLFYYLPRYDYKLRLMKKAQQKIYIVDNGFIAAKAFSVSENVGRLLENQVLVELVRRGYDTEKTLFYYRSRNDKETDFVTRKGTKIEQLIQVCYSLDSDRTLRREVGSLIECAGELHCEDLIIVTMTEERTIEKDGYTIRVVPIDKF